MTAISSTAGARAAMQVAFQQFKLQQARQNAEKAEQVAQALEAKAADAQQEAGRAEENARSLSVQSEQARSAAGQAHQGVAMIRSVGDMQARLVNTASQVGERLESRQVSVQATMPVVNTSGQVTGTVVNTTA